MTNVSLIAGVGGGGGVRHAVVLAGLAGLVAGAFSMATGEFTSVRSQNELVEAEVAVERNALAQDPDEERRELATALSRRGLRPDLAKEVADDLATNPDAALGFHVQEELGVDPSQLPSPYAAALVSFLAFAVGAAIPLAPYLLGATVLWLSLAVTGLALTLSGGLVAHLTGRSIWLGMARQLGLGVLAAGITFLVGRGIGTHIS